ncbi:hypothetical protein WB66_05890 [bacteria symbiont BFo1 of Frankliniella occidentalis]|jgi:uncharacterized DUF497 family protein|uniref:BrnT family toxin n=1 Tax=Erwinia TaxID=551 RepID=UPI0006645256|nr:MULTISPECIES: BrnT family toxin [Erwinia]KMV71778.1 hypothetical protein AI28_02860 [bacteria symbiont BFo1 of Frankliniella occidentalis]PIJ59968.1 hypothetical protein BOM23_01610 [Erwinia sp. OLMDLW33]KYP85718.1 hypothetical protein WB66_05890 [bacteria symbiont BFo1 of Frankliniella occidentalis]KYP91334.1 hypothetical protein WB91_05215 [bacteria symbiont BFo1 of Frankliniella occidentalis]MBD1375862.1 BrnT family toxin [Erwinia aphidicola]
MPLLYLHHGYTYEWDSKKAQHNLDKHKISFELACEVFDDPNILSTRDLSEIYGEERWQHLGEIKGCVVLLVVSTDRNDNIRIISARKALPKEIGRYRQW